MLSISVRSIVRKKSGISEHGDAGAHDADADLAGAGDGEHEASPFNPPIVPTRSLAMIAAV